MFICLGVLPVLILFSLVAGWLVWNSVAEAWSVPVYLQYGEGNSPYSEFEISSLATNQPYDVSLRLSVPATESNFALGNFMVSFAMHTQWNTTIADVRKPALVVPPAPSVVSFLSRTPNLVEMSVPLVFSLISGSTRVRARVELGRGDGWRTLGSGEGRELSVFSASLHGEVRPQGLRRILSTFPLSLSLAASITFFVVSVSVLSICLLPSMLQQRTAMDSGEGATERKGKCLFLWVSAYF
ncbi:hypothetical protein M0805_003374 [Coniferiporia weirii]|nr:hypothetical protein M0805_003374 [Coniferiporia weirii]